MSDDRYITVDGNEAAASVAYRLSEIIAIYPITPASPMGETADEWAAHKRPNLWGAVPEVVEMQSEGGAAGAVHGALQAGALATTFTASQGLLLMIPTLYKIAGELTPFCLHVAARTLATHALSIFGDHSDVMACRQTGFAMLASGSVQEAQDLACIAHASTLRARIPFLHFFDGFRTSHEIAKIVPLGDDALRAMIDAETIRAHRDRALTPDRPVLRGTAQNPDVFFQAREAINPFYAVCPDIVEKEMDRFAELTGRRYRLFEYAGHPDAERVVVVMGSGAETVHETVDHLVARGERVGVLKVRLFRPLDAARLVAALPASTRAIMVLDRTKEPGAAGEPLYQDVVTAIAEARASGEARDHVVVLGGRYGLSSKEFTPAMAAAVFDEARKAISERRPDERAAKNHFTVGITDDVSGTSLSVDAELDIEPDDVRRAVFYGLGSDGTVGANKNTIKILGAETDRFAQGYFVYDSKKSGAATVSHLRVGPRPIRSAYLVGKAHFVGCHQFSLLDRFDVLERAAEDATLLLNAPFPPERVWDELPVEIQRGILEKRLALYVIDAYRVAREAGVGGRINTIMQACFFEIAGILPRERAMGAIKHAIEASYAKKGPEIVRRNCAAVDAALSGLHRVEIPGAATSRRVRRDAVPADAPEFVRRVTGMIASGLGDLLPVSAFPVDGTWPVGTSRYEKRNLALEIPVWDEQLCIQCNKCVFACPHAAIRAKHYDAALVQSAPAGFKSTAFRSREHGDDLYTLQVAPEDCTGCRLCVMVCPVKDKSNPRHKAIDMADVRPLLDAERGNYTFFLDLPEPPRTGDHVDVKSSQFATPLFEYSGACAGCGETPYVKLLTQLFGDRVLIANATGCSSIYGGNLPTTPYTTNADGRGPAWSNSLFEDNAEFGFGMRLALDAHREEAARLLAQLAARVGEELATSILHADQTSEAGIAAQRERVAKLRQALGEGADDEARRLLALADYLVRKSVWLVGGDGWAYDIGFGGLDHVLSSGRDVNVLVLDTEVYSNTGGQQSKATPLGATAKFAAAGKGTSKKDLGLIAMSYGGVYVARVAFGAKDQQTVHAFAEAEAYPGPSLIIAYSPCIAHGYDLANGAEQQRLAVDSGVWPLYRFDPRRLERGEPPLHLDSGPPKIKVNQYTRGEQRFRMAEKIDPARFKRLLEAQQRDVARRYAVYEQLAGLKVAVPANAGEE